MDIIAIHIAASLRRLEEARDIADGLRHDKTLHRLAMTAVFMLEDCHEALLRAGFPNGTRGDVAQDHR